MGEVLVDTQENTIGIYLTEEETLKFEVGNAEIQLIYWIGTLACGQTAIMFLHQQNI